jgi:hypothetical protein
MGLGIADAALAATADQIAFRCRGPCDGLIERWLEISLRVRKRRLGLKGHGLAARPNRGRGSRY